MPHGAEKMEPPHCKSHYQKHAKLEDTLKTNNFKKTKKVHIIPHYFSICLLLLPLPIAVFHLLGARKHRLSNVLGICISCQHFMQDIVERMFTIQVSPCPHWGLQSNILHTFIYSRATFMQEQLITLPPCGRNP